MRPRTYFEQIGGVIRRFLKLEPAVIAGFVRAVVYLAATLGIVLPQDLEGRATGIFIALVAVVEIALTIYTRTRVTPTIVVVEQIAPDGASVIAGPANNQVETGTTIRDLDAPPRAPGEDTTRREYRDQHPST